MRYAILGTGRQGTAAAYDLASTDGELILADNNPQRLEKCCKTLGAPKSIGRIVDFRDESAVCELLSSADAAVFAADYSLNENLTRWAIKCRCHAIDYGGNHDVVHAQHTLHDEAVKQGVVIVPDTGLTPGLAGILVAGGIKKLDKPIAAYMRVGGLPRYPVPPLNYTLLFSIRGLTNEYLEPSVIITNGKIETRKPLTGLEELEIDGKRYEAFYTSGGVSTLPESFGDVLQELDCKTIRYPGHAELIRFAFDLGFGSEEEVRVSGVSVSPREVFETMLVHALPHDAPDVTLLQVTVKGLCNGKPATVLYSMTDVNDETTGFTAMQRTTAFPGSRILAMITDGSIPERGVLYQERVVDAECLIALLRKRGIEIQMQIIG